MNKCVLIFTLAFASIQVFANPSTHKASELRKQADQYERGLIYKRDYEKAYRLYCLAALGNDAIASYSIGWMHFNGRGRTRDMQTAIGWFKHSAALGSKHAQRLIKKFPNIHAANDENCPLFKKDMEVEHKHIQAWVNLISPEYSIDPELVLNVIKVESAFNPLALSNKNAQGLMQLIPATAARFGVKDAWNPIENIKGGVAYLSWLMNHFEGNLKLVLAAYNAGESAVEKYRNVPPYQETENYVRKIMQNYRKQSFTQTRS